MKQISSPQDQDLFKVLENLKALKAPYPPGLLAARRAAFIEQVVQYTQAEVQTQMNEELTPEDEPVIQHLRSLRTLRAEYPSELWNARRSAFRNRVDQLERVGFWGTMLSAIQRRWAHPTGSSVPFLKVMRVSFVIAGLAVAAFLGFLLAGDRGESLNARSSQNGISRLVPASATVTPEEQIICRRGYEPPLCLARKFDNSQDLIFPGNGSAQPAVAKDTKPGHVGVHQAAYINDGMYGPGASWVSNSPDSWIKIDLGKATAINTIAFGRDRLGEFNDGNPGQFVISVALSDDVYANGNSSNDSVEYTTVYDSEEVGFSGVVSRAETVKAQFQPLVARYIKITFENEGTAIDEVEVFMLQPPPPGTSVTKKSGSESPSKTRTPLPTRTTIPTSTRTPVPTFTPVPTDTQTPVPTDTPIPTDTPTPRPTNTPLPTDTDTPVPIPTDTPIPMDTPIPTLTDWLEWTLVPVEPWSYVPDP